MTTETTDIRIALAQAEAEIGRCFPVMAQLRPALSLDEFIVRVQRQREDFDYQLAFLEAENEIVAVAGFRICENLAWGRFLYVDDLVTSETERSQGYGELLFDWLAQNAARENCVQLHLDSGVQRFEAHRFYLKKRMKISSHHFALELP